MFVKNHFGVDLKKRGSQNQAAVFKKQQGTAPQLTALPLARGSGNTDVAIVAAKFAARCVKPNQQDAVPPKTADCDTDGCSFHN